MSELQLSQETAKTEGRVENDFYETPAWMVDILLDELEKARAGGFRPDGSPARGSAFEPQDLLAEPCVGAGNIVRAIQRRYSNRIITNDIDPQWPADTHIDARGSDLFYEGDGFDWVITNPPFNQAAAMVPAFVANAPCVAILLRISWLEPTTDRARFLADNPPSGMIVMERYSFRRNGAQDSATTVWLLWGVRLRLPIVVVPGHGGDTEKLL